MTSAQLAFPFWNQSISSAEASPVRTSRPPAEELASLVLEAASGTSSLASLVRCARAGSSSRTSPAEPTPGSMPSAETWKSLAMRRYRSRLALAMSGRLTSESGSSLLPTLTETANLLSPSMQKWPGHRRLAAMLPTLVASMGSGNRGGENPDGPFRPSLIQMARTGELLPTLLASHPEALRDRRGMKHPSMLPTLCRRDDKGPGPAHTKAGADLPAALGGHLNPEWCLWFMGFPVGWLDVDDAHAFARSGTALSRKTPK